MGRFIRSFPEFKMQKYVIIYNFYSRLKNVKNNYDISFSNTNTFIEILKANFRAYCRGLNIKKYNTYKIR